MLIANYSYINQICGHNHSGITNPVWIISPHAMRGYYALQPVIDTNGFSINNKDSFPTGTNHPYSIMMGDKGALLSATTQVNGVGAVTGNAAMGINIESSDLNGSGTISNAALSLVTQIAATLAGVGALTGSMVGTLQMAANLAGSGDIVGAMGLIANISTTLTGSGALVGALRGTASLEADITPFTTLSPENLATAVWAKALEGTYTAGDIMRLLSAVAAGKSTIVDLGGGAATVTFRDINDTEDRVIADMQDSERDTVTLNLE